MTTVPCPSCGLPRAADLLAAACPICGSTGDEKPADLDSEPLHDRPWVIPEPKDSLKNDERIARFPASLPAFIAGIVVALAGVQAWPSFQEWLRTPQNEVHLAEPVTAAAPIAIEMAPMPREVVTALRIPLPPSENTIVEKAVEEPKAIEFFAPGPMPEPAPRNPFRPEAPRALVLDHGQHYSPRVPPGSTVRIRGWVKKLVIRDLEAGAVLDCSELEAEEVLVIGKVDGGSRLALRAPGGSVVFRGKIDGRSKVEIKAPGGTVAFETPSGMGRDGSKIAGASTVEITARAVSFHGKVESAGTRVAVTLTSSASLMFAEIAGGARFEYSKLDPDDANPVLTKGKIEGGSTFTHVE